MPTDLRERLKALVEEMIHDQATIRAGNLAYNTITGQDCVPGETRVNVTDMWARKLAAILAESESDPHASHGPDCCWRCADDEVRRAQEAARPLGHEFSCCPKAGEPGHPVPFCHELCEKCGQPRSAHEPKP